MRRDVTLEVRTARHLYVIVGFGGFLLFSYATILARAGGVLDAVIAQLIEYFRHYSNWYEYVPEIGVAGLVLFLTYRSRSRRDTTTIALGSLYAIVLLVAFILIVLQVARADDGLPMSAVLAAAAVPPAAYLLYCLRDFVLVGLNRGWRADSSRFYRMARAGNKEAARGRHELLRKWIHRPANPKKSCIYLILFSVTLSILVLYLFLSSYVLARLDWQVIPWNGTATISGVDLTFRLGGGVLLIFWAVKFQRHYRLTANDLLLVDKRRPVLFLRSFTDDKVRLWGRGIWGKFRKRTIDEAIRPSADILGPLVAIADPNVRLPHLGAAQSFYSNDTWQLAIARWVRMARYIVMIAGRTQGIRWELEHIFGQEAHQKLIVFLTPSLRRDAAACSQWFAEHFSQFQHGKELATLDVRKALAIAFTSGGLAVIESRRVHDSAIDYLVAFEAIAAAIGAGADAVELADTIAERRQSVIFRAAIVLLTLAGVASFWWGHRQVRHVVAEVDEIACMMSYYDARDNNDGWETVVDRCSKAIADDPANAAPYIYRGRARKEIGDDGAAADLARAKEIDPKNADCP